MFAFEGHNRKVLIFLLLLVLSFGVFLTAIPSAEATYHEKFVLFVSDIAESNNWDIYAMNVDDTPTPPVRLTTDPGIDNHPEFSPDGSEIVWSSDRDNGGLNPEGDFELFIQGGLTTITVGMLEIVPLQLTSNDTETPDRHPHFAPDGSWIIYDAKDKMVSWCRWTEQFKNCKLVAGQCQADQCSLPLNCCDNPLLCCLGPLGCSSGQERRYEQLHLISPDGAISFAIDPATADGVADVWPNNQPLTPWDESQAVYSGHASISPDNSKILFSASVDGQGDSWEVYRMDWLGGGSVANLRQVTKGSTVVSPNPILLTGGAHYTSDGSKILFTSTRTSQGNSQLYQVSSDTINAPIGSGAVTQLTDHGANDYVPEPLDDGSGRIVLVTDRAPAPTALCDTQKFGDPLAPSFDLDLLMIDDDGANPLNLTDNDANDEMLLIGDEVSWFCGLKRNLSPCTSYPKIMPVSALHTYRNWATDPSTIPVGFPLIDLYTPYWNDLNNFMQADDPGYWNTVQLWLDDPNQQDRHIVMPSIMGQVNNPNPPSEPSNPDPPSGANDVGLATQLLWQPSVDPDGDSITYTVYFGTDNPPKSIRVSGLTTPELIVNDLEPNTTYFWKIVAKDSKGGEADPVWTFTTGMGPPTGLNSALITLLSVLMLAVGTRVLLRRRSGIKQAA